MPRRALGIDFAPGEMRAVQIVRTSKGFRLEKAIAFDLGEASGETAFADALRRLKAREGFRFAGAAASVPAGEAMYQLLETDLPALDAVRRVLDFEMEDEFPRPPEEMVLDAAAAGDGAGGQRRYLVAGAPLGTVDALASAFGVAGIAPRRVSTDALALAELVSRWDAKPKGTSVLAVFAEEGRALLALVRDGRTAMVRDVAGAVEGGERLAADLAREAEMMLRSPASGMEAGAEASVAVVGASDGAKGLADALAEELGRPAEALDLRERLAPGSVEEMSDRWAVAVALALGAGAPTDDAIDFFQVEARRTEEAASARRSVLSMCVLALLVGVLLAAQVFAEQRRLEEQNEHFNRQIRAAFGEAMPGEPLVDAISQIEARLGAARSERERLAALVQNRLTPLQALYAVTAHLPEDAEVVMDELTVADGRVRLRGRTPSFEMLEGMKRSLEAAPEFARVVIDGQRRGDSVHFALTIHPAQQESR